jgi:hypothetical protein
VVLTWRNMPTSGERGIHLSAQKFTQATFPNPSQIPVICAICG